MRHYLFTLADANFFAPLSDWRLRPGGVHSPNIPRGEVDLSDVPGEWSRRVSGVWTIVTPPRHIMREQGWKIHIAPSVPEAPVAITRVLAFCVAEGLPYKVLAHLEFVWALSAKYAPREASGKAIVIYPDTDDPSELVRALVELLADVSGPRVLGSYRVGSSIVHLRYGAFVRRFTMDASGEPVLAIRALSGELIPDRRGVTPHTPEGVCLPRVLKESPAPSSVGSARRYKVIGALHHSNSGGVYRALDTTTGCDVVLKEARHYTAYDASMAPATERLRHQREAMNLLAEQGLTPRVIDFFTQGDSDFLAYEFVAGFTLQEWAAANSPALFVAADGGLDPRITHDYVREVHSLTSKLAQVVASAHRAGYVLCDVHPANAVIDAAGAVKLIDLEAATPMKYGSRLRFVGAPGFFDPSFTGVAGDRRGVVATQVYLHNPVIATAGYMAGALGRSICHARAVYRRDQEWEDELLRELHAEKSHDEFRPPDMVDMLAEAICSRLRFDVEPALRSAPEGYESLGSVSTAWGLPGAVFALAACGKAPQGMNEAYVRWLLPRIDDFCSVGAGLLDGWAGNIAVATAIGCESLADELTILLLKTIDLDASPLRLRSGLAGTLSICLQRYAESSAAVTAENIEELGDAIVRRAAATLRAVTRPPTGLLDGLAGIATVLARAHDVVGKREYLDVARALLAADLDTYVPHRSGALLHHDGKSRVLGYLDRGNAGFVLAAKEVGGVEQNVLERVRRGSCARIGVAPGLFFGLSGGLAANAQLARSDPSNIPAARAAEAQVDAVCSFIGPGADAELLVPGETCLRATDDIATGSAGVLLALALAAGCADTWLPGVL